MQDSRRKDLNRRCIVQCLSNKKVEEYRTPAKTYTDTITPPQRGRISDGLCGTHCTEMTVLDVLITRIDAKLVKSETHTSHSAKHEKQLKQLNINIVRHYRPTKQVRADTFITAQINC